jgi:hypothetical protein
MSDRVYSPRHGDPAADVALGELEARVVQQVDDVLDPAGRQVIQAHDVVTARDERITQVRPDKAATTRNDDPHEFPPVNAGRSYTRIPEFTPERGTAGGLPSKSRGTVEIPADFLHGK